MAVLVMRIRKMGMFMGNGCVLVLMGVARFGRKRLIVFMLVVRIVGTVDMGMVVFQRLVRMPVRMTLGQVQQNTNKHQRTAQQQACAYWFVKQRQCQQRTKERRHGKVGSRAGGTQMS